ncbi:MAG: hypothetical protein ACJ749_00545 [Flavisolibacter sp.]
MNLNKIIVGFILVGSVSAVSLTSCKKLSLQKDYDRVPDTVDTHVYMNAWDYLKKRATGATANDQIWKSFYDAIVYSGIDSAEYTKPGRTFIFPNTEALTRTNANLSDVGFFSAYQVNNKNGTKWSDYPKDLVKNYLLYLIIEGVYNHYTLPPINTVEVQTLAPQGSLTSLPAGITRTSAWPFVPNPKSTMKMKVLNSSPSNTSDYPIVLNESRNVRTSSIQATNGTIHAIDRFLTTTVPD